MGPFGAIPFYTGGTLLDCHNWYIFPLPLTRYHVARADLLFGEDKLARIVLDGAHRVILIDDQHRLEPPPGLRLDNGDRLGEIEDRGGIERVAVHPDHVLPVYRHRRASIYKDWNHSRLTTFFRV